MVQFSEDLCGELESYHTDVSNTSFVTWVVNRFMPLRVCDLFYPSEPIYHLSHCTSFVNSHPLTKIYFFLCRFCFTSQWILEYLVWLWMLLQLWHRKHHQSPQLHKTSTCIWWLELYRSQRGGNWLLHRLLQWFVHGIFFMYFKFVSSRSLKHKLCHVLSCL